MNSLKSFYLELLRVFAAFYVFIFHVGSESIDNKQYLANERFVKLLNLNYTTAHFCVMIFFVLSGYLISMSASKPNLSFRTFIISRLGRIYSVLIPALFFSFFVVFYLKFFNYPICGYIEYLSFPVIRFILNLFFLGQAYSLCSVPPFNGAFWSVQYEFIYYLFLGVSLLVRKWYKYLILIILTCISWIKVLLLMPVWFTGSLLFYIENKFKLGRNAALLLFTLSTFLMLYYLFNFDNLPFQKSTSDNHFFKYILFLSWNFRTDYIFGIIVFFNMFSFFHLSEYISSRIEKSRLFIFMFDKTKLIGNCSYTLYLFHTPLLFFFATVLPYNKFNTFHVFGLIVLVLVSVYFIARLTEWKVLFWRQKVSNFFEIFDKKLFNQ